jgi:hypothetical protein
MIQSINNGAVIIFAMMVGVNIVLNENYRGRQVLETSIRELTKAMAIYNTLSNSSSPFSPTRLNWRGLFFLDDV